LPPLNSVTPSERCASRSQLNGFFIRKFVVGEPR
jgi:hypothetical protein